jgi:hypothetical protein
MLAVLGPFFSLYTAFVVLVIASVWLVHRTRRKAREDEEGMSEAACAARVEGLLRTLPGGALRRR